MLQDASVLGKSFTKQALTALNGASEERVESLLSSLVRKEVLTLQADPRSPERGQYAFLQDLLRQVAYDTLARRERKRRHLAAAEFLERSWRPAEEEIAGIVAAHYVAAIEAASQADDVPQIATKARLMLAQAGERAASLAAPTEAQRYFEQAAALAGERLDEAALRELAGEMAWMGGNAENAREQLGRALVLFEADGRTHPAARVSARLGEVNWQTGELEQALAQMERAFTDLAAEEPDADYAALAAQLGRLHLHRGEFDQAEARIATALTLAETLWLPEILCQALNTAGFVALWRERPETALALVTHALELALEHNLSSVALRSLFNLAEILRGGDRYEEALARYEQGLALARKVGNRLFESWLLTNSAEPLLLMGRWHDAAARLSEVPEADLSGLAALALVITRAELESARGRLGEAEQVLAFGAEFELSADVQERLTYAAAKATFLQAKGEHAEALAAAEEAIEALDRLGWRSQAARMGLVTGIEAAFELGDLERAEQLIASIEARPPGAVPRYLKGQAKRLRARLLGARCDQRNEAERQLKSAAASFRELGLPFWAAVTELELGEWLASHARAEEASTLLAAACDTFERLQATPWLQRAEAARTDAARSIPHSH